MFFSPIAQGWFYSSLYEGTVALYTQRHFIDDLILTRLSPENGLPPALTPFSSILLSTDRQLTGDVEAVCRVRPWTDEESSRWTDSDGYRAGRKWCDLRVYMGPCEVEGVYGVSYILAPSVSRDRVVYSCHGLRRPHCRYTTSIDGNDVMHHRMHRPAGTLGRHTNNPLLTQYPSISRLPFRFSNDRLCFSPSDMPRSHDVPGSGKTARPSLSDC